MVGEYGSDQRRHEKKQRALWRCVGGVVKGVKMTDGVAVLGIYGGCRTALHRKLDFSSSQIQNS